MLQRLLQRLKKRKLSKCGLQRYPISITLELLRTADSWALPQRIHHNLFLSKVSSDAYPQESLETLFWKIPLVLENLGHVQDFLFLLGLSTLSLAPFESGI